MSKQSYVEGFCKAAEAHGVDPYALYELIVPMRKEAQSGGIWDSVKGVIEQAKQKWNDIDPNYKPLVGSLVGGGLGAGAGALAGKLFGFGAGRGALAGLGIGGLGGALYGSSAGNKQLTESMKADKAKALEEAGAKSKAEMDAATAKHDAQVGGLNKQIADLTAGRKSDAAAAAKTLADSTKKYEGMLSAKDADKAKALADLAAKHEAQTAATAKAHEGMVGGLNKQIADLTAGRKSDASSIKKLKSQLGKSRKATEAARMLRDGKIDITKMTPEQLDDMRAEVGKQQEYLQKLLKGIGNKSFSDYLSLNFGGKGVPSGAPIMTREQQISEINRRMQEYREQQQMLFEQLQKLKQQQ